MALRKLAAYLFLLAAAACASLPRYTEQPNIYVMRHLHTPAHVPDAKLTAQGHAYAAQLSTWFERDPPDVIYVSNTKRAQQTAAPLAARLGLAPKIYDASATLGVVASALKEHGTVLIVGHSNTVSEIIRQLGGISPAPLSHNDFADVWRVHGKKRLVDHWQLPAPLYLGPPARMGSPGPDQSQVSPSDLPFNPRQPMSRKLQKMP